MAPSPEVDRLAMAIMSVPPWHAEGRYTPQDWEALRRAALSVQRARPEDVEQALEFYGRYAPRSPGFHDGSRPHLLMRMVFDLPPRVPRETFHFYANWTGSEAAFRGDTVNPSWPIRWEGATPTLVSRYRGIRSLDYLAVEEYRALRARYPMRDLGRVLITGAVPGDTAQPDAGQERFPSGVELGQSWAQVREFHATLQAEADTPSEHVFTVRGEAGEELMAVVAAFSGSRVLLLFKDGGLHRVAEYPSGHRRDVRPGYFEVVAPARDQIRDAALTGPAIPIEGLVRYAKWAHEHRLLFDEYLEPPPFFGIPVLLLGKREPVEEQRAEHKALLARFNATKVRLGDTSETVRAALGAPRETRPRAAAGELVSVYGELADLGWYPAPQVVVTYRGGKAAEVWTEHYVHTQEEDRKHREEQR